MSLDLSLYDDAALEAFAPKGLVRRARRDLGAGLASIKEHEKKHAVVEAEGQTVRLDASGPKTAQCTCPASGVCRHVLVAVMALNAAAPNAAEDDSVETSALSALDELRALAQADIQSFAGADWAGAVALANTSTASTMSETGRNVTIEIEGSPASVTFLAGLGLKGAAHKGPKTRARLLIAAAALIARAKQGVAVEQTEGEMDAAQAFATVTRDYLDDASAKLAQCARMVLAGASPVAADTLFDLAISARTEAAPRLTAHLRALTKQAGLAAGRHIHFEPEMFLAEAARTYALIEALKATPEDPDLTGVTRRDYKPAPELELWMLGASRWYSETGARGLTLHGYAPADGRWVSVTQARGAGADPTFDPQSAFAMPMWGAGSAKALVGKSVRLPKPLIAHDGSIAPTLPAPAAPSGAMPHTRALIEAGAAATLWADLRRGVASRVGAGLHRRAAPLAALIAPTKFGTPGFDDFTQNYELEALDMVGAPIRLVFAADAQANVRRLSEMSRPPLLLAETSGDLDRPALRPIAIVHDGADGAEVISLTLEHWPHPRTPRATLDAIINVFVPKTNVARLANDPLNALARRALEAATTVCAGEAAPASMSQLEQQCDAAGLALLASALRHMESERSAVAAFGASYVAGEVLASLNWS